MKATGIVVEYNPFHNGHAHHLNQSKKQAEADVVIAVMSGNFLQRGEPALVDKWTRTKMALHGGVDLVIELPYVFATAQASDFAKGAIVLLEALECESFCFGSEDGALQSFMKTYDFIDKNRSTYEHFIHEEMKKGISYPKALNEAYRALQGNDLSSPLVDLTKPNNILGYHYVEAAMKQHANIKPLTIQRIAAGYHDTIDVHAEIASATGIRKALFDAGDFLEIENYMPSTTLMELQSWRAAERDFGSWETFWPLLRYELIRSPLAHLRSIAEITEGMEFALKEAAIQNDSFSSFMMSVKSKRYTWTRIQRMLTHVLTNFTQSQRERFHSPSYIRILGMSPNGQMYLNEHKKEFSLPIISRVAASDDPMLSIDINVSRLYELGVSTTHAPNLMKEYKNPPIRL